MNGRLHSTAAKIFWILFSCYCLLFFPSFCAKGWSWSWKRLFLWEIHRERQETWGWIALTCNLLGPLSAFVNVSLVGHWDWPLASFLMWTIYCSAKWREHILDDFFGTSFAILVWSHFLMISSLPQGKLNNVTLFQSESFGRLGLYWDLHPGTMQPVTMSKLVKMQLFWELWGARLSWSTAVSVLKFAYVFACKKSKKCTKY